MEKPEPSGIRSAYIFWKLDADGRLQIVTQHEQALLVKPPRKRSSLEQLCRLINAEGWTRCTIKDADDLNDDLTPPFQEEEGEE